VTARVSASQSQGRGRGPSQASRHRILDAAASVSDELGYDETTIARITERAGLPASSLYWHFKDKDTLLAEVVDQKVTRWIAQQPEWTPVGDAATRDQRLQDLVVAHLQCHLASPDVPRAGLLLSVTMRVTVTEADQRLRETRDIALGRISRWFEREFEPALDEREPRLPHHLARLVLVASDGMLLAHNLGEEWDIDEYAELVMDALNEAISRAERTNRVRRSSRPAGGTS
jgi:AcrR family transcriptional regulator